MRFAKYVARIRRFVLRAMADFSPRLRMIMGSMRFSHARWLGLVNRKMCSFADHFGQIQKCPACNGRS